MLVRRYLGRVRRSLQSLRQSIEYAIRYEGLGRLIPQKPIVLQFAANDICNSRCVMCNIWQRKRDHEVTPDELRGILSDPLFSKIRYVGMTGGEPTLRKDLPQLGQALVDGLPRLIGFGIITNGIVTDAVISRALGCADVARKAGKSFSVMVSLDGVGDDHDRNRGVQGNFQKAVHVLRKVRAAGVQTSIGCTLTPENCNGADDLLAWIEEERLSEWSFRLGVEIKRVYNDGYFDQHRFTPEQVFHLTEFFDKLSRHPAVSPLHQTHYRSLVGQLADGAKRLSGCDWRTRGVTLDTRGGIGYCSVKSPVFATAFQKPPMAIYRENTAARDRILRDECGACMHDLRGPMPVGVAAGHSLEAIVGPVLTRSRRLLTRFSGPRSTVLNPSRADRPAARDWRRVLITGWYGTETAGDKAILAELIHFLRANCPAAEIELTTLNRVVSQQTNREIVGTDGVKLVPFENGVSAAKSADAVVVGGGPLMEIDAIRHIEKMFISAHRRRKARIIFGCGVGPVWSKPYERSIANICRIASAGFVRDVESFEWIKAHDADRGQFRVACDPALGFLFRWREENMSAIPNKFRPIIGLLRANTREYFQCKDNSNIRETNRQTAQGLATVFDALTTRFESHVDLLAMHSLHVGGDDRLFNRAVAAVMNRQSHVTVQREYLTLDQTIRRVAIANAGVAMRYHGHLFCLALGIPYFSIDYTGGGKVARLTKRLGRERFAAASDSVDCIDIEKSVAELLADREKESAQLIAVTRELVGELHTTYADLFNAVSPLSLSDAPPSPLRSLSLPIVTNNLSL